MWCRSHIIILKMGSRISRKGLIDAYRLVRYLFFHISFLYWRASQHVPMAKLLLSWVTTRIFTNSPFFYNHSRIIQILTLESHPRRRLRWSGRWKGKNLVRVQRIWRFRYGPPTHLKGLHRTVCTILSYLTYALICAIHWHAIQRIPYIIPTTPHPHAYTYTGSHSHPNTHANASFSSHWLFFLPILDSDCTSWFCPSWISRWATYSKGGFKEGVSLSVDDELNRWQKYSYGCNEWVFNWFILLSI